MSSSIDIPTLLLSSLNPSTRKEAEAHLTALSSQSAFLMALLELGLDGSSRREVRLGSCVLFKNVVRRRWAVGVSIGAEDDERTDELPIPDDEKASVRARLIPAMIALSTPGDKDKSLRAQIAETIATVADVDFPERWEGLIDELISNLTPHPTSYLTNLSLLETAHALFIPWRSSMRTDSLYTLINFVLSRFVDPFLQLFRYTANTLFAATGTDGGAGAGAHAGLGKEDLKTIGATMDILIVLFYDLTCQDVPPAIEDANEEFFSSAGQGGWFMRFLGWEGGGALGLGVSDDDDDPDDPTPSIPSSIKTHVFELAELYTHRYPELLSQTSAVESFVRILYDMLGLGRGGMSAVRYDALISQSLRFLSTAIRSGTYAYIFQSRDTIASLIERAVLPNVALREHDITTFHTDPLEYIRLDLSLSSGSGFGGLMIGEGGVTRRQAAGDVVRALVSSVAVPPIGINLSSGSGAGSEGANSNTSTSTSTSLISIQLIMGYIKQCLDVYNSPSSTSTSASTAGNTSTSTNTNTNTNTSTVPPGYGYLTTDDEWICKSGDVWKNKDVAVYLYCVVAASTSLITAPTTGTGTAYPDIDIIQFFSDNVFADLQADPAPVVSGNTGAGANVGGVHPILQVDAIRYLYIFRGQLTKLQLLAVLPILLRHLASREYVCYSYAALTIERILCVRDRTGTGRVGIFTQSDIQEIAPSIIDSLLTRIENAGTPEKIAENDYLMKCIMRTILTARQTLFPTYDRILRRLVAILGAISRNPSNPNFDQYLFESLAGLIRFIVGAAGAGAGAGAGNNAQQMQTLQVFEQALFSPLMSIVQMDIDQYIPYVFQLLAQMLELHQFPSPSISQPEIPTQYRTLLPHLLQPNIWLQKGSIPGLVRILKAFLSIDTPYLIQTNQFLPILAVVQQKLIPSKLNDVWGFMLLRGVLRSVPASALKQYMHGVVGMLLTRLQTGKTDMYNYHFIYFCLYTMCIRSNDITPDFFIGAVEGIQPQLWPQILTNIILPNVHKTQTKDRKVAIVGLTRMLTESEIMLSEPAVQTWPETFAAMIKLFNSTSHLESSHRTDVEDPDELLRSEDLGIDGGEGGSGAGGGVYQVAYSRLAASENILSEDPIPEIRDTREFLGKTLMHATGENGDPRIKQLVNVAVSGDAQTNAFMMGLRQAGYLM